MNSCLGLSICVLWYGNKYCHYDNRWVCSNEVQKHDLLKLKRVRSEKADSWKPTDLSLV